MDSPDLVAQGDMILQQLRALQVWPFVASTPTATRTHAEVNVVVDAAPSATPDPPAFVFTQSTPEAAWTIEHGLNSFPSVTLTDADGNVIVAQVRYVDPNTVVVTFSQPVAGSAYLNM